MLRVSVTAYAWIVHARLNNTKENNMDLDTANTTSLQESALELARKSIIAIIFGMESQIREIELMKERKMQKLDGYRQSLRETEEALHAIRLNRTPATEGI
jgi:hypothetical protein